MIPSLSDIEKGVRANFILNPKGNKYLEADEKVERDMKSAARIVFIAIAANAGHRAAEICDYVDMTLLEFNHKLAKFRVYYREGQEKTQQLSSYHQLDSFDPHLRIYRKYNLVKNYLNNLSNRRLFLLSQLK